MASILIVVLVLMLLGTFPRWSHSRHRHGLTVAGVSLGVETRTEDKVSPALSAVMIVGGLGAMIAGKRTAS